MPDLKITQLPFATALVGTEATVVVQGGQTRQTTIFAMKTRTQRSVTASPITVAAADEILNVNISTGSPTCALPAAATRAGIPITFKDVGGQFEAHNLTLTPNGAETIDGLSSYVLNINRDVVTLVPINDGVNSGWIVV